MNLNSSIISDVNYSKFKIHLCSLLNSIFKEEHIAKLPSPFSDKFCSTIGGKPNIESRQHFQGGVGNKTRRRQSLVNHPSIPPLFPPVNSPFVREMMSIRHFHKVNIQSRVNPGDLSRLILQSWNRISFPKTCLLLLLPSPR